MKKISEMSTPSIKLKNVYLRYGKDKQPQDFAFFDVSKKNLHLTPMRKSSIEKSEDVINLCHTFREFPVKFDDFHRIGTDQSQKLLGKNTVTIQFDLFLQTQLSTGLIAAMVRTPVIVDVTPKSVSTEEVDKIFDFLADLHIAGYELEFPSGVSYALLTEK